MAEDSKPELKTTVIVPAYQAANTLQECLDGLLAQTTDRLQLTIIVVNDGSTDDTAMIAQAYANQGVRLVQIKHAGAAAARNAGVQVSSPACPIILFTDADCVATPKWAERLANRLIIAQPKVAGVKGTYQTRQKSWIARFVQAEFEERYDRFRQGAIPDFADTYSAAYRRDVLLAHPFDEGLPGAVVEDAELGWRLRRLGYLFEFEDSATVWHQHPATAWAYFRRKFRIGRWRVDLYLNYPNRLGSDSHTSQAAKLEMLLMLAVVATLIASLRRGRGRRLALSGLAVTLAGLESSYARFSWRLWQRNHQLWPVVAAWPLLHLRSVAFVTGALWGLVRQLWPSRTNP